MPSYADSGTCNLTINVSDNGRSNIASQTVDSGSVENFTFTPDIGYSVADVMVNGTIDEGAVTSLSLTITGDTTVDVSFAINTCNLTVNVGDNGSSNIASQTVNWGSVENFTFTPDIGYSVADVMVNGTIDEGAVTSLSLTITGDTTVDVSFAINTCNLTVNVGDNGSSNIASQTVNWGSVENFTFTPDIGYSVADVMVNGTIDEGAVTSLSLTITGDTTVDVSFAINTCNLTVNVGDNGSSNIASQTVNWGSVENFTFTPDIGYSVADVMVNGTIDEGAVTSLSLTITGDTTVDVSFALPNVYPYFAHAFNMTGPTPPATPSPTPPATPSPTPTPTVTPTATPSQTPALATMGQYLSVIVAVIVLGAVVIGVFIQRRKRSSMTVLN